MLLVTTVSSSLAAPCSVVAEGAPSKLFVGFSRFAKCTSSPAADRGSSLLLLDGLEMNAPILCIDSIKFTFVDLLVVSNNFVVKSCEIYF